MRGKATLRMQLGEVAKAKPAVAIGSYPFFDPQHGPNTNVVPRAPAMHISSRIECRGHNQAELRPLTAKTGVRVP
jgi:hypothetical protein